VVSVLDRIGETRAAAATDDAPVSVRLEAIDLECERQDRVLFSGLSFALEAGGVLQLEGQNGSGKTTLLRVLCGLSPPAAGEVRWCGRPIGEVRAEYAAELAYVGHAPGVKDDLTPLENLRAAQALLGAVPGLPPEEALERLGLAGYEDVLCRRLSAGQRRRVALARLLVARSRLWILDEPFTALDRSGIRDIERMIEHHTAAGGMVVLSTHRPLGIECTHLTRLCLTP